MTIPDTPAIADAIARFTNPEAQAAATRLRALHRLGSTEAANVEAMRADRDAARTERDARPTREAYDEVITERDALLAQIASANAPAVGPFSVPIVQFRAGLIPLRLRLLAATERAQAKWGVILEELAILSVVYPRIEPVASLLNEAVAEGLMTEAERAALRGE